MDNLEKELRLVAFDDLRRGLRELDSAMLLFHENDDSQAFANSAYRALHNIKSNSRVAGLDHIAAIAHRYEDLVGRLKNESLDVTEKVMKTVVDFCSTLNECLDETENDKDAVFSFDRLISPLNGVIETLTGEANSSSSEGQATGRWHSEQKILIIDDDDDIRDLHVEVIEELLGIKAQIAADGLEALKLCREVKFDLILTDHQMPNMNGMDFIEQLKSDTEFKSKNTPVIMITGFKPNFHKTQKDWHNVFFLYKPVREKTLSYYMMCAARLKSTA